MKRPTAPVLLGLALALGAAGCGGRVPLSLPSGYHGLQPPPGTPGRPSFVLTDTAGERYDFAERTAGRPTYLYFGYTNCPDECPTSMADLAAALRQSPSALRERARVVLVTADPSRDAPAALRRFLDQFSEDFVGLTGTQAQVDAAQRAVGLDPARPGPPPPRRCRAGRTSTSTRRARRRTSTPDRSGTRWGTPTRCWRTTSTTSCPWSTRAGRPPPTWQRTCRRSQGSTEPAAAGR